MKVKLPKIIIVRERYSTIDIVPKKLRNYLVDLNHYFSNVEGDVCGGRNKEVERIFNSLLNYTHKNQDKTRLKDIEFPKNFKINFSNKRK